MDSVTDKIYNIGFKIGFRKSSAEGSLKPPDFTPKADLKPLSLTGASNSPGSSSVKGNPGVPISKGPGIWNRAKSIKDLAAKNQWDAMFSKEY